jgi:transcriptional regulator with XRE-family HTH domain
MKRKKQGDTAARVDFPARLRQSRRGNGLTQEQLGERAGVSKVSISLYESGRRTPDMQTLQRIADALQVSVDHLLGRDSHGRNEAPAGVVRVDDPKICRWFDELVRAPREYREELQKIWAIIKKRDSKT